jgi:hypothetical protein
VRAGSTLKTTDQGDGMNRSYLDRLISAAGLAVAAILLVGGGLLMWGHVFIGDEVHSQLAAQQIAFPVKGSPATAAAPFKDMRQYAGQQLLTGAQAETYADHFIAVHLQEIGGGQTYAQLSTRLQADPTNATLAKTVQTVFQGETLRGLLLNAYAFGTMGVLAGIAAIVAFAGGALMLVLSGLGLRHARRAVQVPASPAALFAPTTVPR